MIALQKRLNTYREKNPDDWQEHRYPRPEILEKGSGGSCFEDLKQSAFNIVDTAHGINRRLAHGWYTDNFQNDTLVAYVVSFRHPHKLNSDGSHLFYLAATQHSDWDMATVDTSEVYDNPADAAQAADDNAERDAESYREEDMRYQAVSQIEDRREEIHRLNKIAMPLLDEIKQAGQSYTPAVCDALRVRIEQILHEKRMAFDRIALLTDSPWESVL